jgi:octaprenyl-diphosphate synthase
VHLLAARFCGYRGEAAIRLGTVLELIHTATLVHDDIIDAADTRRGRPSANRRWGNSMTVLAGDWLYMEAFRLALAERNLRILDILTQLTQMMVEGELLQLSFLGRADMRETEALDINRRKTACLFSACLQLGALLGQRTAQEEARLAAYGLKLGMAFQIIDDLLDFTAQPERLGKPVVNDLREGKVTLPLIYALQELPAARARVETVLQERGFFSVLPEEIVALVRDSAGADRALARAADFAAEARRDLEGFPDSVFKRALQAIPQFVLTRDY